MIEVGKQIRKRVKHMKKILKKVVACVLVILTCISLTARETCAEEFGDLTDEMILSLTASDYEECYEYLVQFRENNIDCTNQELDKVAKEFYIWRYNEKLNSPIQNSFYDDLLLDATGLNADELVLAKKYPSDLAAIYSSAQKANNQAKSRYNSGAYLGNQDAFRHASWNALIICRFYALGKGDFDWCLNRTREWTTAHETGAEIDTALSASQRQADYDMDILNNAAGREAARTTFTSEAAALTRVQSYVDDGYCKRIKSDSQMGYVYEQMKNISSWTLKPTNTVGKK